MKLHRPYIPKAIRVQVLERQLREAGIKWDPQVKGERRLKLGLAVLFGGICRPTPKKIELHHRPALCNREIIVRPGWGEIVGKATWINKDGDLCHYEPDANDPEHLVYLVDGPGEDHDVETRVRGLHGQHSDLGLRRKRKRKERKETARLLRSGPWGRLSGKRKWPKRPFPKGKRPLQKRP